MAGSGGMSESMGQGVMNGLQFIRGPEGLQIETVLQPTRSVLNAVIDGSLVNGPCVGGL